MLNPGGASYLKGREEGRRGGAGVVGERGWSSGVGGEEHISAIFTFPLPMRGPAILFLRHDAGVVNIHLYPQYRSTFIKQDKSSL